MSDEKKDPFKPTFHPKYTEIANAYMDIIDTLLTPDARRQVADMRLKTYLSEYRTVMMGGPRQTGITTWAIDHAGGNSLIVCPNKEVRSAVIDLVCNHRKYTGQGTETYPCVATVLDVVDNQLAKSFVFDRVYVMGSQNIATKYHTDRFYEKLAVYLNKESIIFLLR